LSYTFFKSVETKDKKAEGSAWTTKSSLTGKTPNAVN